MIGSISQLIHLMESYGANRFYAKKLAPNDNSKNQIYIGRDFKIINMIPYENIYADTKNKGSDREHFKADINFYWIDSQNIYPAKSSQLILYTRHAEVRLSSLLTGCSNAPSEIMKSRDKGRTLFLGITPDGKVLGYAGGSSEAVSVELYAQDSWELDGVLIRIPQGAKKVNDTRELLLQELTRIYKKHWIASGKLNAKKVKEPYAARNAGGYTLEAELGISPNGYSEPDYMGWEIKQYSVLDFTEFKPKSPVTLMTPEPTGGLYKTSGVQEFLNKFGYPDKNGKEDRINFGGIYTCDKDLHADTGVKLVLEGYDNETGKISDMDGGIALISANDEIAASWSFTGIMQHWNRKHSQAAFIPSLFRKPPPEYSFGPKVELCQQTDFLLFLSAIASGTIYYDPAVKMEKASSTKPAIKKRNQFRIKHKNLASVYHNHEEVLLT